MLESDQNLLKPRNYSPHNYTRKRNPTKGILFGVAETGTTFELRPYQSRADCVERNCLPNLIQNLDRDAVLLSDLIAEFSSGRQTARHLNLALVVWMFRLWYLTWCSLRRSFCSFPTEYFNATSLLQMLLHIWFLCHQAKCSYTKSQHRYSLA